ncbi:MAG: nitrate- and nitrite sensing domain-containing protein [Actinomycetota bacterium]|nr:nitrate- and nitrite sensing domain-containing protein [Actinomycetota bacterium]
MLIPAVAALVLGGFRMQSALSTGAAYARLENAADLLPQVDALVDSMQTERDQTVGDLSAPPPRSLAGLGAARSRTDADIAALRTRLAGVDVSRRAAVRTQLRDALAALSGLGDVRRTATWGGVDPTSVATSYTRLVQGLLGVPGLLAAQSTNGDVARRAVGLESLAGAKEAVSQQRLLIYRGLRAGGLRGTAVTDLIAANMAQRVGVAAYLTVAPASARALYRSTVTGPGVAIMAKAMSQVLGTLSIDGLGVSSAQWLTSATEVMTSLRRVQDDQRTQLAARIRELGQSARHDALLSAEVLGAVLGLALIATLVAARSIRRPLKALRSAALGIAHRSLPDRVRQQHDRDPSDAAPEILPIAGNRQDEIGDLARAIDAVHSEAARLAGHEALMRARLSALFSDLSLRSKSLVERQLRLIDKLEAGEQDAGQLAHLFQLDHLATQMRRNDENLLVLAGTEGGRRRRDPVPMLDVLRAATAEVEDYARVRLDAQPGVELAGPAVNDVVHLLAELVENATHFSPQNAPVRLQSRGLGAGGELMIEVEDSGIGMSPAELAAANEELVNPPGLDVCVPRRTGLFVVSRLAQRHGIRVLLLASAPGGLTAFVRLPANLVAAVATPSPRAGATIEQVALPQSSPIFEELQSQRVEPRWSGDRVAHPVPGATPVAPRPAAHLDATESHALTSYPQGIHRARGAGQGAIRHEEPASADVEDREPRR